MKKFHYIVNKFLSENYTFNKITKDCDYYDVYIDTLKKLEQSETKIFKYEDIMFELNKSNLTNDFVRLINNFKRDLVFDSEIHGIDHIIRCSLYTLIISVYEKISQEDFKILLDSILYHDIGRISDEEDKAHGFNATKKIGFLKETYSEEDYNLICAIISAHSIDDEKYLEIAKYYNIEDTKHFYKLLSVIKDADALDRTREYPYINIDFLRNYTAKSLVPLAYEFYYNYENTI